MNFLAHAYLADGSDESLVGSLMGDFVKGPLDGRYSAALTRALALHRRIDTFTDTHAIVVASRGRVSAMRRRYAGILVDLFYDHFLALHWNDYAELPLREFTARVYGALQRHAAVLPARLRVIAPRMAATDWLASYREVAAVGVALDRIGDRLKRANPLSGSAVELSANYDVFEADFRLFFPNVVRFARSEQET